MRKPTAPILSIRLLGEFSLDHDGAPVTDVNTPRLQSLLAYLLLHRDAPQSRAHLAFQFWPDSAEPQARSNLRTLLHRLRQALPAGCGPCPEDPGPGAIRTRCPMVKRSEPRNWRR